MNSQQAARLRVAVRALVRAEVAYSWKGNLTDRDDIMLVEQELKSAKSQFGVLLRQFTDLSAAGPESNLQSSPAQPTKDETQS